ncbi:hypothetical protein YC2023_111263 [Brassica napus]
MILLVVRWTRVQAEPHAKNEVKAAYRKKVWESHPDLFPDDQKLHAESMFKSISEAYSCLESGDVKGQHYSRSGMYSRVVKTGVPRTYAYAKRGNAWLIGAPFLLIVLGTIGLGGVKANRAYNMQKQTFPSHNPFLP